MRNELSLFNISAFWKAMWLHMQLCLLPHALTFLTHLLLSAVKEGGRKRRQETDREMGEEEGFARGGNE